MIRTPELFIALISVVFPLFVAFNLPMFFKLFGVTNVKEQTQNMIKMLIVLYVISQLIVPVAGFIVTLASGNV